MNTLTFGYEFEKELYNKFINYVKSLIARKIIKPYSIQAGFAKHLINTLTSLSIKKSAKDNLYNDALWAYIIKTNSMIVNLNVFKNAPTKDIMKEKDNLISNYSYIFQLYKYFKEIKNVLFYETEEEIKADSIKPPQTQENSKWGKPDILVGSLRNKKQLSICLKYNFYHTPCKNIDDGNIPSYIAIYQSKHYFKEDAGIKYVAKIDNYEIVKRCDIKEIPSNSKEEYYKFYVSKWKLMENQIEPDISGSIFLFTNLFLLSNAKTVYELSFKTKDEYDLYMSINTALNNEEDSMVYEFFGNHFIFDKDNINIYRGDKLIFKISKKNYLKNTIVAFENIKKCISLK